MIKFIPYTITTGFTAGIALTILIGQCKDFFGLTYPKGTVTIETPDKLKALFANIGTFNPMALLVGVISLGILILWPRISKKIPGSLIAVFAGIFLVQFFDLKVNTIGDLYTISNRLPAFHMPAISLGIVRKELSNGFTIAILAAIESLLSAVVADSMINSKHRSNAELLAQGIGNIGSVLFGGIPATGAIARTAANIKNGGLTPIAGMVHSVVLVAVLVILMPYASYIPMPTIAAILFMVAYNMCGWRNFLSLCKKAPKSDIIVLITTFVLTVVFDLVVAIGVGMITALVLFMKRMSEESELRGWQYALDENDDDPDAIELRQVPKEIRVYEIDGPLFFGVASMLDDITAKDFTKVLIIRMRGVPAIDATAMQALDNLADRAAKKKIRLIFSHVNAQPMRTMEKAGFIEKIGKNNFQPHIDDALARAQEILSV